MTVHTLTGNDPSQGRSMAGDDKGKNGVSAEGTKWTYKQWYERNKEKLAERRKARYHSDKKYKAKVLKQNKDYREKKAKERDTEKPKIKPKLRSPKQRQPIEREVQVNGHREIYPSVGEDRPSAQDSLSLKEQEKEGALVHGGDD